MNENEQRAFIEAVVLTNPFDLTEADSRAVGNALRQGRRQIDEFKKDPGAAEQWAAGLHLDEWRFAPFPGWRSTNPIG